MRSSNGFLPAILLLSLSGCPGAEKPADPILYRLVSSRADRTCAISAHRRFCWGKSVYFRNNPGTQSDAPPEGFRSVALGTDGSCEIDTIGKLVCRPYYWTQETPRPTFLTDNSEDWEEVSAGEMPCALSHDGELACWSSFGAKATKRYLPGRWDALSAGRQHVCAISAGELFCWGDNTHGQLGIADDTPRQKDPHQVAGKWSSVSAGETHTCALAEDQSLWCWGSNADHKLGPNAHHDLLEPRLMSESVWTTVSAGVAHTCAIDGTTGLWCWGSNRYHESRGLQGEVVKAPTKISSGWIAVTAGSQTTCAQRADGSIWCWGDTRYRKLGDKSDSWMKKEPVEVQGGPWTAATLGKDHTCAIDKASRPWCWGLNANGQLGYDGADHHVPRRITDSTGWSGLTVDERKTCGMQAGSISCWGRFASENAIESPMPVTDLANVVVISAGVGHLYAVDLDGKLWYVSRYTEDTASSFQADTSTSTVRWRTLDTGEGTGCGITLADEVRCWGVLGPRPNSFWAPVSQTTVWGKRGLAWSRVATEGAVRFMDWDLYDYSATLCAISGDGALSCADLGETGRFPFTVVSTESDWRDVDVTLHRFCAVRAGGSLWCWGWPGEKGVQEFPFGAPRQFGSDQAWDRVWLSARSACALRKDDSLWCWGDNTFGQLGTADTGTPVPHRVDFTGY